ncbi:MAG: LON peptidase substrate-binding domain-containing protein, partial [Ruminococcus sp.]|nr:LON peptidase substrate-binding domain-containing protein [Ruminococcus sp.]
MNEKNTMTLPVLPLRGMVVFPKSVIHFDVGRKQSISAITRAMKENQLIFLATQKDPAVNDPKLIDLYSVGVVAKIAQVLKQPDDITRVVLEGKYRAKALAPVFDNKLMLAELLPLSEQIMPLTAADAAMIRSVKTQFEKYLDVTAKMPPDIIFKVALCKYPGELADYIASTMFLDYQTKQSILEILDPSERLDTVLDVLIDETYISKLEREIEAKAKARIDENQQIYFLREQKRAIEEQLGEEDDPSADAEDYAEQIEKLQLDKKTEDALFKECRKLMKMPYGSQEASVIRTYLDTVLDLPWHVSTEDKIVLPKIRKELDKSHYGLEKIKDRIIEQLAVRKLSDKQKGQVICFVGPPGVGKTSIAQSIAKAIGR